MELELIFTSKNDKEPSINDIKRMLNNINIISFDDTSIYYENFAFNYSLSKAESNKSVRLNITNTDNLESSTQEMANTLSSLKNAITNSKNREEYYITTSYNSASEYYNNELFRLVSNFERKLRQLIYLIVNEAYGSEWTNRTIDEDTNNAAKRNTLSRCTVENILSGFTFCHYVNYLFVPKDERDNIIQNAIEMTKRNNITKNDIHNTLNKPKYISLWNKLFKNYAEEYTRDDLENIEKIRNIVAHNKEINEKKYIEYKDTLMNNIKTISSAITQFKDKKCTANIDYFDAINQLIYTSRSIKYIQKAISSIDIGAITNIAQANIPLCLNTIEKIQPELSRAMTIIQLNQIKTYQKHSQSTHHNTGA